MTLKDQIVVAGHICLDIIPDLSSGSVHGSHFFTPGKLAVIGPVTLSTGGPVSNTGLALSILGIPTTLMGKVGNDHFGELMKIMLAQRNVNGALTIVSGDTTSYTIALSPPGYDRMFLHDPAANNTFCAEDINYKIVAEASIFHLGYPPLMKRLFEDDGRQLTEIFRRVKQLGVTTSLDMSLPDPHTLSGQQNWRTILSHVMPYVDIFLPSAEETLFMLDRKKYDLFKSTKTEMLSQFSGNDFSMLSETLLDMGGKIIGLKCGERGFYLRTSNKSRIQEIGKSKPCDLTNWVNREVWEPSFHVDNYSGATGSGDSSIAGFLAAYKRGHSLEQTLRLACAVGGFNVTAPDALSGIKGWNETITKVESGWIKNPLSISDDGWYCDENLLWHGPFDRKAK